MTEQQATHHHHKIKAEWAKSSRVEIYAEPVDEKRNIEIIEQIIISSKSEKKITKKKCGVCEKTFCVESGAYEEHLKVHEDTFFECPEEDCKKKFRRKSSLRKHSYFHVGKFKYKCSDCSECFVDRSKYEIHVASKHNKMERIFKCEECPKTFSSSDYLKKHLVTHRDEYKYNCKICEQKFKWMTSLQLHMSIHNGTKSSFQCSECHKT